MPVAEMLSRMSGEELTDWQAYEMANGPLGPVRGDWHAALIASTLVAVNRGKKGKRPKVEDFLLDWKSRDAAADPLEMEKIGKMLASRLGGTWTDAPGRGGEASE